MTKRVAMYLRVSTSGQTVENQRRDLDAVIGRMGWRIVAVYEDAGSVVPSGQAPMRACTAAHNHYPNEKGECSISIRLERSSQGGGNAREYYLSSL